MDMENDVRLSHYPNGWGVKTEVNGTELKEVRDIRLDCPVGELPRLTVQMNAGPGLDVVLKGEVVPIFSILEPEAWDILAIPVEGGGTRYHAVKRADLPIVKIDEAGGLEPKRG